MKVSTTNEALILLLLLTIAAFAVDRAFAFSPLEATVKTDKTSYQLRQDINIQGNVTYNDELVNEGLVGIQVKSPSGLNVTRTCPVGPTESQNFDVEILLVTLCDLNGNPKQSLVRGSTAYFRAIFKNTGLSIKPGLIATINIYDNDSTPIGIIAGYRDNFGPGDSSDILGGVNVDPWVKNGTGTVYANAYSDWPERNGCPYCPEKAATFAILESEYDETPPAAAPEQPIQNGTYTLKFRLSPEPAPGTYTVYATAWYQGWKTDLPASTTFQVVDIQAPPCASFVMKPPMAAPGYLVQFDASSSSAEGYGDSITSYAWNFGDGQNGTGKIASHTYTPVSNYVVTLNVTDNEGFWNTTSRTAIIAIVNNTAIREIQCINAIYNNWKVQVSVKAKNLGTVSATFNVTVYANGTFVGKTQVSNLGPFLTTTVTVDWNTSGLVPRQNRTLRAVADTLPGETNTTDNTLEYGPIFIRLLGDVRFDQNGRIDILDLVMVTSVYSLTSSSPNWNIMTDLAPDGKIDILDVVKITSAYGTTY
jgi:PKD repeat protein